MNNSQLWTDFLAKHPPAPVDPREAKYYHAPRLSFSSLKNYMLPGNTPAHWLYYHKHGIDQTDAMLKGKASDCKVFTPHEFDAKFAISPNRQSNEGKAKAAELEKTHWLLTPAQMADVDNIVRATPRPWEEYTFSKPQMVLEWEYNGIPMKGCPDNYTGNLFDLKTISDSTPKNCFWTAKKSLYHYQLANYFWGLLENGYPVHKAFLVFVQNKALWLPFTAEFSVAYLESLIPDLKMNIDLLCLNMRGNDWPGHAPALWHDMAAYVEPEEVDMSFID